MIQSKAIKEARKLMQSGYYHHSYEMERAAIKQFFESSEMPKLDNKSAKAFLHAYNQQIAISSFRGMKNTVLACVTRLCREVSNYGADMELSFSLSDYYFRQVEMSDTEDQLVDLLKDIFSRYWELAHTDEVYSLPVIKSIQIIKRNIYSKCTPSAIADALMLHPNYLSSLFAKETGQSMVSYIRKTKMKEASYLLLYENRSVIEVAELLGYSSLSYFSYDFKKYFGLSPREYTKQGRFFCQ